MNYIALSSGGRKVTVLSMYWVVELERQRLLIAVSHEVPDFDEATIEMIRRFLDQ